MLYLDPCLHKESLGHNELIYEMKYYLKTLNIRDNSGENLHGRKSPICAFYGQFSLFPWDFLLRITINTHWNMATSFEFQSNYVIQQYYN